MKVALAGGQSMSLGMPLILHSNITGATITTYSHYINLLRRALPLPGHNF